MGKHTKGPWKLWREYCPEELDQKGLVIMPEEAEGGGGNKYIIVGGGNIEANARLIAAAPELLEALRAIMEAHGPGTLASEEIYMQACVAIAKAEGRE